jgi:acetolactate synthase II small subunit
MSNTLHVEIHETEGALVRLIGLIERRGFVISSMSMDAAANGRARITLDVAAREGVRQVEILARQIERLFDVHSVFCPDITPLPIAAGSTEWRASCPAPQ